MSEKPKINPWITKKKSYHHRKYYSLINKFIQDGKVDSKFIEVLSGLSLEDVIALKLEQANRMVAGKLYGLPIFYSMPVIAKNAAVKYALSCARTATEAAGFLGISYDQITEWKKKYDIDSYFEDTPE